MSNNSTHRVEVVPVVLEPHPNADSLSLVRVWGYQVVVKSSDWEGVTKAAYIPPDSVVPACEAFAFLGEREKDRRIRCRRFRGVVSMGLLHAAPAGAEIGDDVAEALGIVHYEPPIQGVGTGGDAIAGPPGLVSFKYDIEAWRRYGADAMIDGEFVMVTEKIHGANARYVYSSATDTMFCGSRAEWKAESASNLWWRVLAATPAIEAWCRAHPDDVLYGEAFGAVQDLRYGHGNGGVAFAAFDILRGGVWVDGHRAYAELFEAGVPMVPMLYYGPYDAEHVESLADGPSLIPGADHIREGVVVKPEVERCHESCGRVALKIVSNAYLERAA